MSLELTSIPLAFVAGILSVLSPCVWPLVPVVMSSAATTSGRAGPAFLALGLSVSFAVAGTVLTLLLVSTGLDPELFRNLASGLLIVVALPLLIPSIGDELVQRLSRIAHWAPLSRSGEAVSAASQFGVGALLGLVWLPCVGPTLGAAIALASLGQSMGMAFPVMFTFGVGTSAVLLVAGLTSNKLLARWRPRLTASTRRGKKLRTLLLLGLLVLTGIDKALETMAARLLPEWVFAL